MPVEGGARVAIIEGADRMNEDAQSALLKTLEEPPAGVTIVLCADGEARAPADRPLALLPRPARARRAARHRGDPRRPRPGRSADRRPSGPAGRWPAGSRARLRPGARGRPHPGRADPRPARPDRCPPVGPAGGRPGRRPAGDRARGRPRHAADPAASGRSTGRGDAAARQPATPSASAAREPRRATTAGWRRRTAGHAREPSRPPTAGAASRSCSDCGPMSRATSSWSARAARGRSTTRSCSRSSARSPGRSSRGTPRRSSSARRAPPSCSRRTSRPSSSSMRSCSPGRAVGRPPDRAMTDQRTAPARLDATVLGRVQGVGFRYFVLREAMALGLDGWVANTPGRLGPVRRGGPARPTSSCCSSGCARVRRRPSSSE